MNTRLVSNKRLTLFGLAIVVCFVKVLCDASALLHVLASNLQFCGSAQRRQKKKKNAVDYYVHYYTLLPFFFTSSRYNIYIIHQNRRLRRDYSVRLFESRLLIILINNTTHKCNVHIIILQRSYYRGIVITNSRPLSTQHTSIRPKIPGVTFPKKCGSLLVCVQCTLYESN